MKASGAFCRLSVQQERFDGLLLVSSRLLLFKRIRNLSVKPQLAYLSPLRRIASQRHHGARDLRNQLSVGSSDVANVAADRSSSMDRFSDRFKSFVPNGSEEIDLQVNAREALPFCNGREVSRADRRIRHVTQDSAMNRPHGIRMEIGLGFHFEGSRPFTDIREHKSKSLHDRKREIEHRLGRWRDCTAQKFFHVIEIADLRHDMLCAFCDTRTDSTRSYSLCFLHLCVIDDLLAAYTCAKPPSTNSSVPVM
jgi:hypothetical protein